VIYVEINAISKGHWPSSRETRGIKIPEKVKVSKTSIRNHLIFSQMNTAWWITPRKP
jgi:hypothetical protein